MYYHLYISVDWAQVNGSLSHVGASRWDMGLVESSQEVRSGSSSELIVSLQMYSKGQNNPRYLETQGKGGWNSILNEKSKQRSHVHPRRAPVEGIGDCRETERNWSTQELCFQRALYSDDGVPSLFSCSWSPNIARGPAYDYVCCLKVHIWSFYLKKRCGMKETYTMLRKCTPIICTY